MKKFILIGLIAVAATFGVKAESISTNVLGGSFINLLPVKGAYAKVNQVILTATTATNATVVFYDNYTNLTYRIQQPYTNTVSYATNIVTSWTNYFGVVNTMTNLALVDNTNNVVGLSTNTIPAVMTLSTAASTSTTFDGLGVNYYFHTGIWVTNTGSGAAAVTITYQQ